MGDTISTCGTEDSTGPVPVGFTAGNAPRLPPPETGDPEEMKAAAAELQKCIDLGYGKPLRPHFGLDPSYVQLNHGSFGTCPLVVNPGLHEPTFCSAQTPFSNHSSWSAAPENQSLGSNCPLR